MQSGDMSGRVAALHPVVHIGYHRTASTFLQLEVFPRIAGCRLFRDVQDLARALRDGAGSGPQVGLVSDESLSGTLDADAPEMAERIHAVLPEARIVVFIRSQFSIFRSLYFLHVKGGGTASYEAFVRARLGRKCTYLSLISHYRELFGAERVGVFLFEDLRGDSHRCLGELLSFMGVEPKTLKELPTRRHKPSPPDLTLAALRLRNQLLHALNFYPGGALAARLLWAGLPGVGLAQRALGWTGLGRMGLEAVDSEIVGAYGADNVELFALIGKSIKRYGYPQP